ncbi:MAG TPA: hypothetical protein VLZ12_00700, partial [Verrucomicrobiae bacterium]|nr:hypothetical protein [Verrucomicrobiae bacterium]
MQRTLTGCGSTLSKLTLVTALTIAIGLSTPRANAVDVFTDPVGFITLTAHGTVESGLSFWGLGMTQIPASVGLLTGKSGTQLSVNSTLTAGQFNQGALGPLYFIEITSGSMAGLLDDVVSNSTAAVFTASDLSGLIAGNENYKVYPHWTIGSIFGTNNTAGMLGGATAAAADQIVIPTQSSQSFATYFWFTGKGGPAW